MRPVTFNFNHVQGGRGRRSGNYSSKSSGKCCDNFLGICCIILEGITLLSLGIAGIVCFFGIYKNKETKDYILEQQIDSWQKEYVSDIKYLERNLPCGEGWDSFFNYRWGGLYNYCDCDYGKQHIGNCSSSSESTSACRGKDYPGMSPEVLNILKFGDVPQGRICVKRIRGYNYFRKVDT